LEAFEAIASLLLEDAASLPDGAIAVRECWQAVQQARDGKLVRQFAPMTRQLLLDNVAPLMSSIDLRGQGDALRWDLLMCKAQASAIDAPGVPNPYRSEVLDLVDRLPPHLNPVRGKATELKAIRSDAFWQTVDFKALEAMRRALRDVVHLAEPAGPPVPPPLVTKLDVREDPADFKVNVRPTNITSIDYGIYRKAVQAALEPLFETDPVLLKIRRGEPVSEQELGRLNSLLHTRNPDVDLGTLREFFPDTAVPMAQILRSIVGHDHAAVEARFTAFAQTHALDSSQLRFLAMLKDHIRQFGALSVNQLFEAPFTTVHAEGLGGVFPNETQLDDVVRLVRSFGEPVSIHPQT
jgi:type I restriction enzyme R subunit